MSQLLKHSFTNTPPIASELMVGEIALQLFKETAVLYTKSPTGEVLELGKGALSLADLEDIDLTNAKEGSFLVKSGDKFVASNSIGSIGNISDVEISNPIAGEYLRYDPTYLSFRNFKASYNLFQLSNVDIPDPTISNNGSSMQGQVLTYDHASGKFVASPRRNLLNQLDDVQITSEVTNQLLQYTDGMWKNMDLHIVLDTSPTLGGPLNANGNHILNSTYRVNTLVCNLPNVSIDYSNGDYWILQGVDNTVNPMCVVDLNFSMLPVNSVAILMLEIRQASNIIVLGGLLNIQYEDGKPISLSGPGKTDLVTVTVEKVASSAPSGFTITTYVTAAALNVAGEGNGGSPAFRYDKNRYESNQLFSTASLYDDYFSYVYLLLNFETEGGSSWYSDKSKYSQSVSATAIQKGLQIFSLGLEEHGAEFLAEADRITVSSLTGTVLSGGFTVDFFINHSDIAQYKNTAMDHVLYSNTENTFYLKYKGDIDSSQLTYLELKYNDRVYRYYNAYLYFSNKESRYIHVAVVRHAGEFKLYVDGVYQVGSFISGTSNVSDSLTLSNLYIGNFKGIVNTFRLTLLSRYIANFNVPNMRVPLVGGEPGVLPRQVFSTYTQLRNKLACDMFS